jgi:hypothetical protein
MQILTKKEREGFKRFSLKEIRSLIKSRSRIRLKLYAQLSECEMDISLKGDHYEAFKKNKKEVTRDLQALIIHIESELKYLKELKNTKQEKKELRG